MSTNNNNDDNARKKLTEMRNGMRTPILQCATWENLFLRSEGYPVYDNAWDLTGVIPVFNGYLGTTKPASYDRDQYLTQGLTAANNIYNNFDAQKLDTNKIYVVNMQHFPSGAMERAYNEGHDYSLGTHTGILYYPYHVYPQGSEHGNDRWLVNHDVVHNIHVDKFNDLLYNGDPKQHELGNDVAFVTSVMKPEGKGTIPFVQKVRDKTTMAKAAAKEEVKKELEKPFTITDFILPVLAPPVFKPIATSIPVAKAIYQYRRSKQKK